MPIDPNRLTELRNRQGLSKAELAAKSKITQRQIARLEGSAAVASAPRQRTVNELAKALGVEPGVLTGEMAMPEAPVKMPPGVPRQVSAWLWPETSLACALIGRRYGVNLTTLINAAPFLFVLLAESSFVWREERLKEVEEAMKALEGLASGYRRFPARIGNVEEGVRRERESIKKRDLFGEHVAARFPDFDQGHDPYECNPFADYLRDLAGNIGNEGIVAAPEGEDSINMYERGPLKGFPQISICDEDLTELACGCRRLVLALRLGLRIGHMPEPLLTADVADDRREWLEQQIEEQFSQEFKNLLDLSIDLADSDGERATP